MITKSLDDLLKEINEYEDELNNCATEDAKEALRKEFVNNLRLYLFETKAAIKEIFSIEISPFKTEASGFNGLLKKDKNASAIVKKTKQEFYDEIDQLANSGIYYSLNDDQKNKINNAFYVLKTYYEDELN